MAFKCKIGLHTWDGCKCSKCGKTRDEQHDWSKDCEKCSKCGKTRYNQHDYSKDCEKCSKCSKSRDNQHDWITDCDKCSKCGKTRENKHNWITDCDKCSKCGKTRESQHTWVGCKCSKCSKTRDEQHYWSGCKCLKCGKTRDNEHSWDGCKCSKCDKTRDEQHDYSKDCEKCSKCGKSRENQHVFNNCRCSICSKRKYEANYKDHKWNIKTLSCENCSSKIPFDVLDKKGNSIFNDLMHFEDVIGSSSNGFIEAMIFIYGQHLEDSIKIMKSLKPKSDYRRNFDLVQYYKGINKFFLNHTKNEVEEICEYFRFASSFVLRHKDFNSMDDCALFFVLLWLGDKKEDIVLYYEAVAKLKVYKEVSDSLKEAYQLKCFLRSSKSLDEKVIEDLLNNSLSQTVNECIRPLNINRASYALICLDHMIDLFINDEYTNEFKIRNLKRFNESLHAPNCTTYGCSNPYVTVESRLNELLKLT